MQRLTAKELQRRYRAGERNFADVDLSGESLRGMNLKGIDLSGADLSRTDIRGTQFVNTTLQSTQFTQARAGLQRRCLVGQLAITLPLATILHFVSMGLSSGLIGSASAPESIENTFIPYITLLFMTLGMFIMVGRHGLTLKMLNTMLVVSAVAVGVSFAGLGVGAGTFAVTSAVAGTFVGAVAGGLAVVGTVAGAVVTTISVTTGGKGGGLAAVACALTGAIFLAITIGVFVAGGDASEAADEVVGIVAGTSAGVVTVASVVLNSYVVGRALKDDEKFSMVRRSALALGAVGGTSFAGADLTGAYFAQAILKNTNFADSRQRPTLLHNVRWKDAKKLDRARVGSSILQNPSVRDLVLTLNGIGQKFAETDLRGANLAGANLVRANFTGAILSAAVLAEANLQEADFTEASCIGTDFSCAHLTGATLEAWNIESSTCLDKVHCDYVYLLRNQQERRPSSGTFAPGDFTKLFQEVLDTIDLIFQNGIDWKAFIQTFKQIQEQYSEAELSIQSIENKGDGVVVVKLNAVPGTDKPVIHQSFNNAYQLALKEIEALYREQLDAKNEQIADFREQVDNFRRRNADLHELAKLKARQPVTIDVKNVEKIVQGNDNSRNISIGGNATGNVFQTGDSNTASIEFQQVTLPPPDRVNIQAELAALQAILAGLNDPVTTGIAAKVDAEAAKPAPDKSVVATTLETGLTYARNLQGFAEAIDQLRPHVQNAAGWLGEHGTKLLPLVGLML
ncbi:hypothetical protein C7293_14995 [filamentous cyanobacterium CCT1]|nr:hypothetical protein C7293_14995 [filamentous cyanobacterium CCT1]PSN80139.1 hypothetical protein C8B47_07990 [filamentous cyanobacterium CCP4]